MSAEAPKQTGVNASSREPKGCLSGFLRRLFVSPQESQQTQQPVSKAVQLPIGMEGFAAKIQQSVATQRAIDEQRELEQKLELERKMEEERAEVAQKTAQEEAKKRELEEQHKMKMVTAETEGTEILTAFRVQERLEVIRQTVWEGMGEITTLKPDFNYPLQSVWDIVTGNKILDREIFSPKPSGYDLLAGMELVFRYQDVYWMETRDNGDGGTVSTYASPNTPGATPYIQTLGRKLSIRVFSTPEEPEESGRKLLISSGANANITEDSSGMAITVKAVNADLLLEETLVNECVSYKTQGFNPSKLESEGRKRVAEAFGNRYSQNKGQRK